MSKSKSNPEVKQQANFRLGIRTLALLERGKRTTGKSFTRLVEEAIALHIEPKNFGRIPKGKA